MLTSNCSFLGDLQEPFRWIGDVTVMGAFESGTVDSSDFYFTGDDYRYRIEEEAKRRFLDLLRRRFNSGVTYKGRGLKWDTVIEQKTAELGRYLVDRSERFDFSEPAPMLFMNYVKHLQRGVLSLKHHGAYRVGIGKSSLNRLRKNAQSRHSSKVCASLKEV